MIGENVTVTVTLNNTGEYKAQDVLVVHKISNGLKVVEAPAGKRYNLLVPRVNNALP